MHTGQRGAAHVNIFFFLIMLVLFLGALGFAYVTLDKNNELEARIQTSIAAEKAAKAQTFLYGHYVEELSKEVGDIGEYAGKDGFDYSAYGNPVPLQSVSVPSRVRATMRDFANAMRVPESRELATLFGLVKSRVDGIEQQSASLATQKATAENKAAQLESSITSMTAQQRQEVDRLNSQVRQRTDDYTAAETDLRNTINSGNTEYTRIREEKSNMAAEHAVIVAGLRKEADTLGARIDAAADKVKLVNPASAPDGMVIDASQATGLAWINLGRRDMLALGTTFEIVKAGTNEVKAFGVVRRLEQTRAEMRITGLKDRFDPVANGDMIRNDLYSPEMRHNIYLMGRFSPPLTRPMVKTLLTNLGNTVSDELVPGVDLILVGGDTVNDDGSGFTPIGETEEYKLAQFLRIEMAPLSKMRQFLQLTDDTVSAR